jgi:hypothetical protein
LTLDTLAHTVGEQGSGCRRGGGGGKWGRAEAVGGCGLGKFAGLDGFLCGAVSMLKSLCTYL